MLELINGEREQAGLNPVEMGDNIAAQLHSESALKNCFASHWGLASPRNCAGSNWEGIRRPKLSYGLQ